MGVSKGDNNKARIFAYLAGKNKTGNQERSIQFQNQQWQKL